MKIVNGFTKNAISKLLGKVLRGKTGYDIGIQVHELDATVTEERALVHLSIDAQLNKKEFMRILKSAGLG